MKPHHALILTLASLFVSSTAEATDPDCIDGVRSHAKKQKGSARGGRPVATAINRPLNSITITNAESCVTAASSGGAAWTNWNCVQLKKSEYLWKVGQREAAVSMLCNDKEMREALQRTGSGCAQATTPPSPAESARQ